MNKGVSIIICCYNSEKRLSETLRHISLQIVDLSIQWEVVIVNNASKDNTAELAYQVWKRLGNSTPFQVVDEPTPGLSSARERGFSTARYEYIILCDDDNWLQEDYVQLAYEIMESDERIGALGGVGEPICEISPPAWFKIFADNYATGVQGNCNGDITSSRAYVFGAGAVYRKSVIHYLKSKGFETLLTDRKGDSLACGGDVELGYAMSLAKYKIWYDKRLRFKHFIPKERLTWNYIERMHKGYVDAMPVHLAYQQNLNRRSKYKKTWQWLILMRILLFIRKQLFSFEQRNAQSLDIRKLRSTHDLDLIKNLFIHRKTYTGSVELIEKSAWNRNE
jgi:glycosyltransferase involved in cell wall biosynthesis